MSHDHHKPFLSVVIPAYNEEARLPDTLGATISFLSKQDFTFEIVVVDDGSIDNTAQVVRDLSESDERVRLVEYGTNRGKGYAVRTGMMRARGEIRVFMDADNSTTIDHVASFLPLFNDGWEVVIGSRRAKGSKILVHQSRWKEALGSLGNAWIRFWAVPGIRDTQAGFKAFSAKAANDVFPRLTLDRWGFDIEALAVARSLGYRISEEPITWVNDARTHVTAKAYFQVLFEVLQVRWNLWRGKYGLGGSGNPENATTTRLVRQ